jgi:hypothetical protein
MESAGKGGRKGGMALVSSSEAALRSVRAREAPRDAGLIAVARPIPLAAPSDNGHLAIKRVGHHVLPGRLSVELQCRALRIMLTERVGEIRDRRFIRSGR